VADLEYRFSPSVGVGYQWFEGPTFNLSTEVGLAYVYEKFKDRDAKDFLGPRRAYAIDWTPVAPGREKTDTRFILGVGWEF
jgi:Protein of unknown function, DUF481